jgi:ribose/xylose/arabinose/galactoside ABC-type transport system permease subunit
VVVALFLRGGAWPVAAAAAALLAGAAAGLVNGLLVTRLKMVPFIITLGTMLVVRGLALGLSRQQTVLPEPPGSAASPTWLHEMNAPLAPGRGWALWPAGVWLMLLCALTVWFVLRHMRFGRHVVAVGSNEATARLCGVEVERVKVAVYVLGGVFAALAGLMLFSRLRIGDPTTADGMELSVIAAVVIGGGSLSGGQGSVAGSLVGALVMGVIEAGTQQLRMESFWQKIITGAIIVAAVALDRLRARATRAGRQSRAEG